jgi:uncharacterized protein YbaA (DUF1428 family)
MAAMSYIDGFVVPVPTANKQAYIEQAKQVAAAFLELGATRIVECWGDDVPAGKLTDFQGAVKAEASETVVFAWFEWPSKEVRDAAIKQSMEDPHMIEVSKTSPFDTKRMILGGFVPLIDMRR